MSLRRRVLKQLAGVHKSAAARQLEREFARAARGDRLLEQNKALVDRIEQRLKVERDKHFADLRYPGAETSSRR